MPLSRRHLDGSARHPRTAAARDPRCAEPLDPQDVPLLGYDGAPSTQRHGGARRRGAATAR